MTPSGRAPKYDTATDEEIDATILSIVRRYTRERTVTTFGIYDQIPFRVSKKRIGASLRRLRAAGHIANRITGAPHE